MELKYKIFYVPFLKCTTLILALHRFVVQSPNILQFYKTEHRAVMGKTLKYRTQGGTLMQRQRNET